MTEFIIPMETGTHADALALVGFADLIAELSGDTEADKKSVEIKYDGDVATVSTPKSIEELREAKFTPGFKFIKTSRICDGVPYDSYDYEENKQKYEQAKKSRKELQKLKSQKTSEELDEQIKQKEEQAEYPHNWFLYQQINVMQGITQLNKIYNFVSEKDFVPNLSSLREGHWPSCKNFPNNTIQLLMPSAGKGIWGIKGQMKSGASGLSPQHINGFAIWMMFRGLWKIADAQPLNEDLKIYVLSPKNIFFHSIENIRNEFQKLTSEWTPIKSDISRLINLSKILVEHSMDIKKIGKKISRRPAELISSIQVSWFKSLGNSRALASVSELSIPDWFSVHDEKDMEMWQRALDAHSDVMKPLNEKYDEEIRLLEAQRAALSSNSFNVMLNFHAEYAVGVFSLRTQEKCYIKLFPETVTKEVLMAMSEKEKLEGVRELIKNEDFLAVAKALRNVTITALREQKNQREIQPFYGLPQEWKRVSKFSDQF
ncbi:MAG: hypothetical protein ACOC80_09400, partial [Petrotogales bacterium]